LTPNTVAWLLTIFEPIGSFGVAFRSNFGPFLACILMAWAAARIPFALLAMVAPASMTIALLLWLASLLYFTALAARAARAPVTWRTWRLPMMEEVDT